MVSCLRSRWSAVVLLGIGAFAGLALLVKPLPLGSMAQVWNVFGRPASMVVTGVFVGVLLAIALRRAGHRWVWALLFAAPLVVFGLVEAAAWLTFFSDQRAALFVNLLGTQIALSVGADAPVLIALGLAGFGFAIAVWKVAWPRAQATSDHT